MLHPSILKRYLPTLLIGFHPLFALCQMDKEYAIHQLSFLQSKQICPVIDRIDSSFNASYSFVRYAINHLIQSPDDSLFIANRNLLRKLNTTHCDSTKIEMEDTLKNGSLISIKLYQTAFSTQKNTLQWEGNWIQKINGSPIYGNDNEIPKWHLTTVQITINGKTIYIPKKAYQHFFSINTCENDGFRKAIEAYESINGKYIYLYIFGGEAANTYFAKLIFDHKGYHTQMISNYYPLSINCSFGEDFIGF